MQAMLAEVVATAVAVAVAVAAVVAVAVAANNAAAARRPRAPTLHAVASRPHA